MASQACVFELQDGGEVSRRGVSLTFPRKHRRRLFLITNQRSRGHLFHPPEEQQHGGQQIPKILQGVAEDRPFQHGISTKVISIIDPTKSQWEVRLLLSPSEISRLSSSFNLIGFVSSCLEPGKFLGDLQALFGGNGGADAGQEICHSLTRFLCFSENDRVYEFRTLLMENVNKNIRDSCKNLLGTKAIMVAGSLTALLAAQLAATIGDFKMFSDGREKMESQDNQDQEIQRMVRVFAVEAEHFAVSHRGRKVHIIVRNPRPDNWACGGRRCIPTGETLEFGQCHKVFSISRAQYEIKFLQSLQESYNMVSTFHVAGFAEHLMTGKWRMTLQALLKDCGNEEMVSELAQLAAEFLCTDMCQAEDFVKRFRKELTEKLSNVEPFSLDGEAIDAFGLLVAVMAALTIGQVTPDNNEESADPVDPDDVSTLPGLVASGVTPTDHSETKNICPESVEIVIAVQNESIETLSYDAPETPAVGNGLPESFTEGWNNAQVGHSPEDRPQNSENESSTGLFTSMSYNVHNTADPDDVSTSPEVTPDTSNTSMPEGHHSEPDDLSDIGEPYFPDDVPCLPRDQPNLSSDYVERSSDDNCGVFGPLESRVGLPKSVEPQETSSEAGTPDMYSDGEQEPNKISDHIPKLALKVTSLGPEDTDVKQSRSKLSTLHTPSSSCRPLSSPDASSWEMTPSGVGESGLKSDQTSNIGQPTNEPFHEPVGGNTFQMIAGLVVAIAIAFAMFNIPTWLKLVTG